MRAKNINELYRTLCVALMLDGEKVGDTLELIDVKLMIRCKRVDVCDIRDTSLAYLCGELIWYFAKSDKLKFISKFSSFWEKISDDGEHCNSAYGHIVHERYGYDQLEKVISILRTDPESRRATINFNVPREDKDTTKDEICTSMLQFRVRNGHLECTAIMRSNDVYTGFPYDVTYFRILQYIIAEELDIPVGDYTHFVCSMHLYDRNKNDIRKKVIERNGVPAPKYYIDTDNLWRHVRYGNIQRLYNIIMAITDKKEAQELAVKQFKSWNILCENKEVDYED